MNKVCILQLDTKFPRIPGDVACPQTFIRDVRIVEIKKAYVNNVVRGTPENSQLIKFEKVIKKSDEELIITSCGFTYYWQDRFEKLTQSNIITSSLCSLNHKRKIFRDEEILILTFDKKKLFQIINSNIQRPFKGHILGLGKHNHLYQAIINDEVHFCYHTVQKELNNLLQNFLRGRDIKLIILECTNLSPYKEVFRTFFHGEIIDILSLVEEKLPGSINPKFL